MGVYPTPLAEICMLQANKFWFYSLLCSITRYLVNLQSHYYSSSHSSATPTPRSSQPSPSSTSLSEQEVKAIKRRLISDTFDIFIPGHVTGWIKSSMGIVGIASVVSTVLSGVDVWDACGNREVEKEKAEGERRREGRWKRMSLDVPSVVVTPLYEKDGFGYGSGRRGNEVLLSGSPGILSRRKLM